MIRLFDIKRKVKQLKNSDKELFDDYKEISAKNKNDLLKSYETDENGLSTKQADERLEKNGQNVVVKREKKSAFSFFVKSFNDKFIYILILLAVIDFLLADKLGAFIILGIAFVSAMIKFVQEYSTYRFNQRLEQNIFNTTTVLRNKKAKEIGAKNTNFVTPNGLDADNHYSTAYDMALIGAYATKNKQFNEITNTKSYSFTDVSAKRSITVNNKDMFLAMDNEAIGIKTGFTGKAGYCFVGAVKSNGRHFVSCVLACGWPPNKSYKWKDTTTLMNYGKREYNEKKIIASGTKFQIEIPNGTKKKINVGVSEGYTTLISEDDNVKSETNFNYKLPIKKRDVVGNIIITINGKKTKKIMLYAFENVEKYDYRFVLKKIMKKFFLFYL